MSSIEPVNFEQKIKDLLPTPEEESLVNFCLLDFQRFLFDILPEEDRQRLAAEIYGSRANGFAIRQTSDVEFRVFEVEKESGDFRQTETNRLLELIGKADRQKLQQHGFTVVEALVPGRVPIVKLQWNDDGGTLAVDVAVGNWAAARNTRLLKTFAGIHPFVRYLAVAVKKWAKDHGVCGANSGNLSSYAFVVLSLFYLKANEGLPSHPWKYNKLEKWMSEENRPSWTPSRSLEWLYKDFFQFYAYRFPLRDMRDLGLRQNILSLRPLTRHISSIFIMDPILNWRNLADVLTEDGEERLLEAIERSAGPENQSVADPMSQEEPAPVAESSLRQMDEQTLSLKIWECRRGDGIEQVSSKHMQDLDKNGSLKGNLRIRCRFGPYYSFHQLKDVYPENLGSFNSIPPTVFEQTPEEDSTPAAESDFRQMNEQDALVEIWEYRNADDGTVQGPFSSQQMQDWDKVRRLKPELLIRSRIGPYDSFRKLEDVFPNPAASFKHIPPMLFTKSSEEVHIPVAESSRLFIDQKTARKRVWERQNPDNGTVEGPFSSEQMQDWDKAGCLHGDLLIRYKLAPHNSFHKLIDVYPVPSASFDHIPPMLYEMSPEAEPAEIDEQTASLKIWEYRSSDGTKEGHYSSREMRDWGKFQPDDEIRLSFGLPGVFHKLKDVWEKESAAFKFIPPMLYGKSREALEAAAAAAAAKKEYDKGWQAGLAEGRKKELEKQRHELEHQRSTIREQNSTIREQNSTIGQQGSTIREQNSTIGQQGSTIGEQLGQLQSQGTELEEKRNTIRELEEQQRQLREQCRMELEEQRTTIAEQRRELEKQDRQLQEKDKQLEQQSTTNREQRRKHSKLQRQVSCCFVGFVLFVSLLVVGFAFWAPSAVSSSSWAKVATTSEAHSTDQAATTFDAHSTDQDVAARQRKLKKDQQPRSQLPLPDIGTHAGPREL